MEEIKNQSISQSIKSFCCLIQTETLSWVLRSFKIISLISSPAYHVGGRKIAKGNHMAIHKQNLAFSQVRTRTDTAVGYYKNLGCEMPIENSITRVTALPSDAEQLSRVTKFSLRTKQPLLTFFFLHTFPSTIVLSFYQFYAKMCTFSMKKCSVRHLSTTSCRQARGRLTPPL